MWWNRASKKQNHTTTTNNVTDEEWSDEDDEDGFKIIPKISKPQDAYVKEEEEEEEELYFEDSSKIGGLDFSLDSFIKESKQDQRQPPRSSSDAKKANVKIRSQSMSTKPSPLSSNTPPKQNDLKKLTTMQVSKGSVSSEELVELMQQQISALQLRNMELSDQLREKSVSTAPKDKMRDEFRSSHELYSIVTPESVKDGLIACDLSNILISDNTKLCFFNKSEEEDFGDDDTRMVRDNYLKNGLQRPSIFNLYELNSKEMERTQQRAWCDTKSFKSIHAKLNLLDACRVDAEYDARYNSRVMHYDAAISAMLIMEQTLNFDDFMVELSGYRKKSYLDAYIGYLSRIQDYTQLLRVYKYHKMVSEEFRLEFLLAVKIRDPTTRLDELELLLKKYRLSTDRDTLSEYASRNNLLQFNYSQHLIDAINLTSRQMQIENEDSRALSYKQNPDDSQQFTVSTIVDMSIADTLQYLLYFHTKDGVSLVTSPEGLRQMFRLSRRRFLFQSAKAHCKLKDWDMVEVVFQMALTENLCFTSSFDNKSYIVPIIGSTRKKVPMSILSPASFVQLVKDHKGPTSLLELIISKCIDPFEKFDLSRKCGCYDLAVYCALKELKEKEAVIDLRRELIRTGFNQHLVSKIDDFLNNKGVLQKLKWF